MTGGIASEAPPSRPRRATWVRAVLASVAVVPGICEMLVTTPEMEWSWAPSWLAQMLAMAGFLTVLLLVGLTSFLGNAAAGVMLIALLWGRWGWRFWQAALASAPYWIVFYRIIPKPW